MLGSPRLATTPMLWSKVMRELASCAALLGVVLTLGACTVRTVEPPPAPAPAPAPAAMAPGLPPLGPAPEGWKRITERVVEGKNDRDSIAVGPNHGGLSHLMLKV